MLTAQLRPVCGCTGSVISGDPPEAEEGPGVLSDQAWFLTLSGTHEAHCVILAG